MLDQLEIALLSALQAIYDQFGWVGVFILMAIENATSITSSEVILAFAGWMLIERHGISPGFILIAGLYAGLGSALGSSVAYWVARLGGRPVIERFMKMFRLNTALVDKSEEQMHKWGSGLVFFGRVIPGVRTLINIPAGLAKMPFPKFFIATFFGTYIWCTLLLGVGYILGHEWMLISTYIKTHIPLVFSLGIAAFLIFLGYHFREPLKALLTRQTRKEMESNQ